jgi:hypothetical protein
LQTVRKIRAVYGFEAFSDSTKQDRNSCKALLAINNGD